MTRDELISALERATGPDRELDWAIAEHLGWTEEEATWNLVFHAPDGTEHSGYPAWTGSVDAALTLVPEGFYAYGGFGSVKGEIEIICGDGTDDDQFIVSGQAVTPTIALCIAALRAHAKAE